MNSYHPSLRPPLSKAEFDEVKARTQQKALKTVKEREHLRLEIQARGLIEGMQEDVVKLRYGIEFSQILKDDAGNAAVVPLTKDRITSIKCAADIAGKLLDKVLPSLKQVELTDDKGDIEGMVLGDIELDNRLRLYIEASEARKDKDVLDVNVISDAEIIEEDFLN